LWGRLVACGGLAGRLFALLGVYLAAQVTTWQYDNARTGANTRETILTPGNVNRVHFGRLFSFRVDGDVYAQPLYLPSVDIPGKGRHNVVFVATEHDSVYAIDADGKSPAPLWQASFIKASGVDTIPARDVECPFIEPELGITSTPVIDYATGTLYVLARTKESTGWFSSEYVQRLHALAVTTGAEKFGGPVKIQASVKGGARDATNGQVAFDPLKENPRGALLLANGNVYLTWASSCDVRPYHGWVVSYDAGTLRQTGVFNTSPDSGESGIWQGDAGPAADDEGNVYVVTGNGKFDAIFDGRDYGDSVLKLAGHGLALLDYFTPFNQSELNANDDDLGSGGPVLAPGDKGHPHLLLVAGKGATLYVIDRDRMGHFHSADDSHAVDTVRPSGTPSFGASAYWQRHIYLIPGNVVLRDLLLVNGHVTQAALANELIPAPGATPTVSANGTRDGIVWALASAGWQTGHAVLHAWDAANIEHHLYSSEQQSGRDRAGIALRFTVPTVANGKVYVGTKGELDVYGLLPRAR
jgi:hypothetical protein